MFLPFAPIRFSNFRRFAVFINLKKGKILVTKFNNSPFHLNLQWGKRKFEGHFQIKKKKNEKGVRSSSLG